MQHQINKIEYEIDNDFKVIIHCENLKEEAAVIDAINKIIFSKGEE